MWLFCRKIFSSAQYAVMDESKYFVCMPVVCVDVISINIMTKLVRAVSNEQRSISSASDSSDTQISVSAADNEV